MSTFATPRREYPSRKYQIFVLVKPRPMTPNLKGIASESPYVFENGRNRHITASVPVAQDRPCDILESDKGSSSLIFHPRAHAQLCNKDNLPQ